MKRDYSWIKPGVRAKGYLGGKLVARGAISSWACPGSGRWMLPGYAHSFAPEQLRPDRPRKTRKELRAEIAELKKQLKENVPYAMAVEELERVYRERDEARQAKPCRCAEFEEEPAYLVSFVFDRLVVKRYEKELLDTIRHKCEPVWRKKESKS